MTPQSVMIELRELLSYLLREDLAIAFSSPIIRDLPGGKREVAPPPTGNRSARIPLYGTLSEFRRILQEGDYFVVLADGSVIQVSYTFEANGTLVAHRLGFHPCPVLVDLDAPLDLDDLDTLLGVALESYPIWPADLSADALETPLRLRAPVRFDYEKGRADAVHAESHAHFCADACRIPVSTAMSVGHFVRFIFRHFLPDVWVAHERLRQWPIRQLERATREADPHELFFESQVGGQVVPG